MSVFQEEGVTMNDLIQQNSFIIAQMRKVKSVFLNYCKLNEKVYKAIMDHEINSADQLNRINNIGSAIDRKLENSSNQMKRLKEKTFQDNQKTKDLFQNIGREIMEKMGEKVDEKILEERVKKIIQDYDSIPENTSEHHHPDLEEVKTQVLRFETQSQMKISKKRRGITAQEMQLIKNEIMPQIQNLKQKLQAQQKSIFYNDTQIKSLLQLSKKSSQQIQEARQDVNKILVQLTEYRMKQKEDDERLQSLLHEKINDEIWEKKFDNFNEKCVKYEIENLLNKCNPRINKLELQNEKVKFKFSEVSNDFQKCFSKIDKLKTEVKIIEKKLANMNQLYKQETKQRSEQINETVSKIYEKIKSETANQNSKVEQIKPRLNVVQQTQNQLSQTIADVVLKKVEVKIGWEMKEMKKGINQIAEKAKLNKFNIGKHRNQIMHIEDIVAKKANFTDLLHHVDGKADKKDFKQIQEILTSPRTQREDQCLQGGGESQRFLSSRRKTLSLSKRPKSPKPEEPTTNLLNIAQYTESKEVKRPIFKQNSKKEKFRPVTANNLFVI